MAVSSLASRPGGADVLATSDIFTSTDGVSVPAVFVDEKDGNQGYRVVSLLGRGAFGRCYEVRVLGRSEERNWACKIIEKSSIKGQKVIERVKYEIRVMRRLPRHNNVVGFHTIFENRERLHILMELCTSMTLHDLLQKRKRLTEFESRYFIAQLASGISALHSAQIIHRDIKHSNLLLDSMNRIKIADFGLSTIADSVSDRKMSFLGTPNFLAPELVTRDGGGHSFGVDVWATGILLYVMLYGKPPFNTQRANSNLQQLYGRIVDQQIEFPPDPHTSTSAKDLINKLCCKSEKYRVKASEICHESWFLIHADSSVPKFMPAAIFDRPIRNLQEFKELAVADPGFQSQRALPQQPIALPVHARGTTNSLNKPNGVTALSKVLGHDTYGERPNRRQPLEPIPELNARTAPSSNPLNGTRNVAVSTLAHTRKLPDRAHAEAEKENRHVAHQLDRLRLVARAPPALQQAPRQSSHQNSHQNSHGYALRSRADRPSSVAARVGDNIDGYCESRPAQRTCDSEATCLPPARPPTTVAPMQCQVRAEFGTVTKLSEEYIPSILKWKDRLQQFCQQTEKYLQRSAASLEAELNRATRINGRAAQRDDYPRVGMYVLSWLILTKYGLGFQLSDGTVGTLFNDNTSLLNVNDSGDYVYVRPYLDRSSIGRFSKDSFPAQLDKKRNVLRSFGRKMNEKLHATVDYDICPEATGSDLVKCLLQALSTSVGLVFLLTGNVLQFNMADRSKLFLYEDTHIFYKDERGNKWHFDLGQGPAMLVCDSTIAIERFLSCLEHAQKVLANWNLPVRQ
ncbi:Cell cycle serine/threonine-protein kinase cdc5/MSD2 [Coemansia sp. BCRC 34301]|nr:Cell cycle serine/threonine-protein kinase cdc5/MSD2 [Coemansia sp. BCRC 34301]